jgi:hypothetical protein
VVAEKESAKELKSAGKKLDKATQDEVKAPIDKHAKKTAETAASLTGVKPNKHGDLHTMLVTWAINASLVLIVACTFSGLRHYNTLVYADEADEPTRSGQNYPLPDDSWFGWIPMSWKLDPEVVAQNEGVDSALLLTYCSTCVTVLATVGIPMALVLCPLHYFFGGGAAKDELSVIGMGNVITHHPWLYYVHGVVVNFVTVVTIHIVYKSMHNLLEMRHEWLKALPAPRCNTVLVEGIPEEWCTDEKLVEFFHKLFPRKVEIIGEIKTVKDCPKLLALHEEVEYCRQALESAEDAWVGEGSKEDDRPHFKDYLCFGQEHDTIQYYKEKLYGEETGDDPSQSAMGEDSKIYAGGGLEDQLVDEREKMLEEAKKDGGINTQTAFVTFLNRREAEVCHQLLVSSQLDEWTMHVPPPVSDIRWQDLKTPKNKKQIWELVCLALIATIYLIYVPLIVAGTVLTTKLDFGPFQPMWESFAPGLALLLFLAFLPTIFLLIFRSCCHLVSEAFAQNKLQAYYTMFLVFFVLMVTVFAKSIFATFSEVVQHPGELMHLMAEHMPGATHFYMDFLMIQWWDQAKALTRPAQLVKFYLFKYLFKCTDTDAKVMSEPEDQDFDGIGARTARLTLCFMIGIVFSTLSPLICLFSMVFFCIARVVFGYLVVYAETKKPDLGGVFYYTQLVHMMYGIAIYNCLMIGVLLYRARTMAPMAIASVALVYTAASIHHFQTNYVWQALPFKEVCFDLDVAPEDGMKHRYIQPEFESERKARSSSFASVYANRNSPGR